MSLADLLDYQALVALLSVIVIDVVLAGDNAVVVGMAASGLPRAQQTRVIALGIAMATVLRIGFAVITIQLLAIVGLTLAGGILLLWVTWKLWREIRAQKKHAKEKAAAAAAGGAAAAHPDDPVGPPKSMRQAVIQIVLADISMSLDNVLAVAGISLEHTWVLVFGLVLSVALMGLAAALIAGLLKRFPWVSYIGLAIIFYVAVKMIYSGSMDVMQATGAT